jgi:hypothetical protein
LELEETAGGKELFKWGTDEGHPRRSAKNNKVPKNIDKKRKVGESGDGCTIAARYSSLFYNSLYSLLFCCLLEMGK